MISEHSDDSTDPARDSAARGPAARDPAAPYRAGPAAHVFSDASVGSPLEELDAVYRKKIETFERLGESARADLHRRAWKLARSRLTGPETTPC